VILAPCGLVRAIHPAAGAGVAQAAGAQDTISILSTVAGTTVEEAARAATTPLWFQLYAPGRPEAEDLVARAKDVGVGVLVITVDTPVLGNRERDVRNGVSPPLRISPQHALHLGPQVLARPAWTWRVIQDGIRIGRTTPGARTDRSSPSAATLAARITVGGVAMAASPFEWDDIAWLRSLWGGQLVVKGLLSAEDARRAADAGAEAVIVSNHGGRQLDGTPATLRVLPEVAAAVGDRVEVLVDGGVRRGSHIVKALGLGARAVLIGRPYLYGLAVGGRAGVERIIQILREEMVRTMALMGCASVSELGPDWVQPVASRRASAPDPEHG
jgi:L-lactate dehydrogenase (cytochrome)